MLIIDDGFARMGGGCAQVYRAYDTGRLHAVALKVADPSVPCAEAMLKNEYEMLLLLGGADVAPRAYSLTRAYAPQRPEIDGKLCLAMGYEKGRTLADIADGGELGDAEAVFAAAALLRAMAEVQERGMLHRDVHPRNVVFRRDGSVRLIDFGAACVCGASGVVADGLRIASGFEPPEAASGCAWSCASDVYSAALSVACARFGDVHCAGDVPKRGALARWARRCLAPDANARPQTCAAALIALQDEVSRHPLLRFAASPAAAAAFRCDMLASWMPRLCAAA